MLVYAEFPSLYWFFLFLLPFVLIHVSQALESVASLLTTSIADQIPYCTMTCGIGCCAPQDTVRPGGATSETSQTAAISAALQRVNAMETASSKQAEDDCCGAEEPEIMIAGDACGEIYGAAGRPPNVDDSTNLDTCGDGCCPSGDKGEKTETSVVDNECGHDGCCTVKEGTGLVDEACQDACCSEEQPSQIANGESDIVCQDGCCAEKQRSTTTTKKPNAGRQDACSSSSSRSEKSVAKEREDPACCAGRPSPCCDVSCLDRLAGRECEQQGTTCSGRHSLPSPIHILS